MSIAFLSKTVVPEKGIPRKTRTPTIQAPSSDESQEKVGVLAFLAMGVTFTAENAEGAERMGTMGCLPFAFLRGLGGSRHQTGRW